MGEPTRKPKRDLDERHSLPVEDPEEAIRALLKVDPKSERVPVLDVHASGTHGDDGPWWIRCRTCGWKIEGIGPFSAEEREAPRAHRCPPE